MEIKLGELKIDAAGNVSVILAGGSEPYVVYPVTEKEAALFKEVETLVLGLVKQQLKIT